MEKEMNTDFSCLSFEISLYTNLITIAIHVTSSRLNVYYLSAKRHRSKLSKTSTFLMQYCMMKCSVLFPLVAVACDSVLVLIIQICNISSPFSFLVLKGELQKAMPHFFCKLPSCYHWRETLPLNQDLSCRRVLSLYHTSVENGLRNMVWHSNHLH